MCFSHLISCLVQQSSIVLCGCPYKRVAHLPCRSAPCQKDIALNWNAPLCSWPVCTSTGPVELMADQAAVDSLPPSRDSGVLLVLLSQLFACSDAGFRLWGCGQPFHTAVSLWLLGSESLPAPGFYPVSSSNDFVGSKSALQDLALGEQIHLALDTCSLKYIDTLDTREIPSLLTKCCCFSSWEGNWGWNLPFFSHPVLHRMLTCQLPREHFNLK